MYGFHEGEVPLYFRVEFLLFRIHEFAHPSPIRGRKLHQTNLPG
jgi:hypothetical protein